MSMTKPTSEQITHNGQILKDVLGPIVSVKAFGAIGDGVADDTAAIVAAAAQIQSNGGGVLDFPPGTYKILPPTELVSTIPQSFLVQLNNLSGFGINAVGASIVDGNTYNNAGPSTATRSSLFLLSGCSNVYVSGLDVSSQIQPYISAGIQEGYGAGLWLMQIQGSGSNYHLDVSMTGGQAAVVITHTTVDPAVQIENVFASIRGYECPRPYSAANSGNNATVHVNAEFARIGCSVTNCRNQRLYVDTKNSRRNGISIGVRSGFSLEDVEVWYRDRDSTDALAVAKVEFNYFDITPSTMRNIRIHLDTKNHTGRSLTNSGTAVWIMKLQGPANPLTPDTIGRGHVLDGLWIDGTTDNPTDPSAYPDVSSFNINTAGVGVFAAPDELRNINIGPMNCLGGTSNNSHNLGLNALVGPATITNFYSPNTLIFTDAPATGHLVLNNVVGRIWRSPGALKYVGCDFPNGFNSTVTNPRNKSFFDTKIGSWRRTIVPTINVGGGSVRTTKELSGDLTGTNNVFLVRRTTDLMYFRLKYVLVADRTNATTGQTIGIKSFTNYMNASGTWNSGSSTLIAVADEVTERTTGTASAITVSFVNGTSAGAYIAVACTNYNGANARAMFELEAIGTVPDNLTTGSELIVEPA